MISPVIFIAAPCTLMTNFHLALFSLYFSLINFVICSAPSSPTKSSKSGRSVINLSPKKIPPPFWFKKSSSGKNEHTWNIFGQWFNQITSKPSRKLIHLKSIQNFNDFWNFISTKQLNDIDRIDLSIFRPGLEPDFAKFTSSGAGYILSYKLRPSIIEKYFSSSSKASAGSVASSPTKTSRNEAKNVKALEAAPPLNGLFPHLRVFDPLITATIECKDSNELPTEILGFVFKKQYENIFFQVFVDGIRFGSQAAETYIKNLISEALPTVTLKEPHIFWLSIYSSKIVGFPSSYLKSSSSSHSSPSRIVTIVNEETEQPELLETEEAAEEVEIEGKLEIETDIEEILELETIKIDEDVELSESPKSDISRPYEQTLGSASIDDIIGEEEIFIDIVESSSTTSSETDENNEATFESYLSAEAPVFVPSNPPIQIKTIEEELFDKIFTESFDLFKGDLRTLYSHFELFLFSLEAKKEMETKKNY